MRRYPLTAVVALTLLLMELVVWDGETTMRSGGEAPVAAVIGIAALGAAASVLTWRWPLRAAAVVWTTSLLGLAVPAWQPFGALLVALFVLARTMQPEVARLALVLALVPLGVNAWNSAAYVGPVTATTLAPVAGLWLLVAIGTWTAGRAGHRSDSQVRDLQETLLRAEEEVRVHERRRIARDLHDIVAHSVTAMVLRAAGARSALPPDGDPRIGDALGDIEESGAQAVRELHRLLHTMHGSTMDESGGADGRPGLGQVSVLLERTRASGLSVELAETGTRRQLDASLDLAAYRCLQEALSNAMRHSGPGTQVDVRLSWGDALDIDVTSHGGTATTTTSRTSPPSGGFGLVGLSERLASVGGRLQAGPRGEAFQLSARIPVTVLEDADGVRQ